MAEVEMWGQNPEREVAIYDLTMEKAKAEKAIETTAIALAQLTMKATKVVDELLADEDPQVRARAVELVYSRTIPKVAAKHLEEHGGAIESADSAALREDILNQIKKGKGR